MGQSSAKWPHLTARKAGNVTYLYSGEEKWFCKPPVHLWHKRLIISPYLCHQFQIYAALLWIPMPTIFWKNLYAAWSHPERISLTGNKRLRHHLHHPTSKSAEILRKTIKEENVWAAQVSIPWWPNSRPWPLIPSPAAVWEEAPERWAAWHQWQRKANPATWKTMLNSAAQIMSYPFWSNY